MNTNTEMELYPKQREAVDAVMSGKPTLVTCCPCGGKTTIIAPQVVREFLRKYPKGKVVATSTGYTQLTHLLSGIRSVVSIDTKTVKMGSHYFKTSRGGSVCGFPSYKPERAEGWHPAISDEIDPVLIIIDNAETISLEMAEAFNRCTFRYILVMATDSTVFKAERSITIDRDDCHHMLLS